jgi:dihydroorotate dehydrogenase
MPDWSYRTFLRPFLFAFGRERAQRMAVSTLSTVARLPIGPAFIDFLGHMRADERLRTRCGALDLAGPIALGATLDPGGNALGAFGRFGVGMIEVGPVDETNVEQVARNVERARVPVCVRIADGANAAAIVSRLKNAALFSAASVERGALFRATNIAGAVAAMRDGAAGVWVEDGINVAELRRALPADAVIVASGVTQPEDARRLLEKGANVVVVGDGLLTSGPGLVKRCNEALLSRMPCDQEPEPLTLDAARRAWFWAFFLGIGMFFGGLLALAIASTRVVLPYDESLTQMTRAQLAQLNPRLLPFMAHDRVSLAGTMLSIGIFYAALGWYGIRRGAHWAQVTVIISALTGFFSFFSFLGFGYFDPFHAFVTGVLLQFTLLCMVMQQSPPQPPVADWTETAAWRRAQWGQLLFILIGAGLTGAGVLITAIGCTSVFVHTDLEFMRTTAEELRRSNQHLVPLVAHDRASLGGMLIANGITVWLMAQWGFRAGARWLWTALAWGGNLAFASAVIVHFVVGYGSLLHLFPAFAGWAAWNVALALTNEWTRVVGSG